MALLTLVALALGACKKADDPREALRQRLAVAGFPNARGLPVFELGHEDNPHALAEAVALQRHLVELLSVSVRLRPMAPDDLEAAVARGQLALAIRTHEIHHTRILPGYGDDTAVPLKARELRFWVGAGVENIQRSLLNNVVWAAIYRGEAERRLSLRVSAPPLDSLEPGSTQAEGHPLFDLVGAALSRIAARITQPDQRTIVIELGQARWSDGTPIVAEDIAFAWRRILDPRRASAFAEHLLCIVGARAFHGGGAAEAGLLGLEVAVPERLVVSLAEPCPGLVDALILPALHPVPRARVEAHGVRWAELSNHLSAGPFRLVASDGAMLVLEPNPHAATAPLSPRVELWLEPTATGRAQLVQGQRDVVLVPGRQTDLLHLDPRAIGLTNPGVRSAIADVVRLRRGSLP